MKIPFVRALVTTLLPVFVTGLFAFSAQAKEVILLISSSPNKPEMHRFDLEDNQDQADGIQELLGPQLERGGMSLIRIQVGALEGLKTKLARKIPEGDHVVMVILSGHGHRFSFGLNGEKRYSGKQIAVNLMKAIPAEKLGKSFSVFLSSCSGGADAGTKTNLQQSLFASLIELSAKLPNPLTEISVLAHNFMTRSVGPLKHKNHFLSRLFHTTKVFHLFESIDLFLLKTLGTSAVDNSASVVGIFAGLILAGIGPLDIPLDFASGLILGRPLYRYVSHLRNGVTTLLTSTDGQVVKETGLLERMLRKIAVPSEARSCSAMSGLQSENLPP